MRLQSAICLFTCLAFALFAAGCGGSQPLSQNEYEAEVRRIDEQVTQSVDESLRKSELASAGDVRSVRDAMDTAANDLEDLEPPKEVATAHNQMVSGLEQYASAFGRFANALDEAKTDEARAKVFQEQLRSPEITEAQAIIEKASDQFKAQGYKAFEPKQDEPDAATEDEG